MITISDIFIESPLPPAEVWSRLQALRGDWAVQTIAHQYPPKIGFRLVRNAWFGVGIYGDIAPKGQGSVIQMGTAPGLFGAVLSTLVFAAFVVFLLPGNLTTVGANKVAFAGAMAVAFAFSWLRARQRAGQHAEGIELVRSLAR